MLPRLTEIMTYRSLWAMCTVHQKTGKMRAVYYLACLVFGRAPLWGVWRVDGRFVNFVAGKADAERQHPNLVWRRVMARWSLAEDTDSKAPDRRQALSAELKAELPTYADAEPSRNADATPSKSPVEAQGGRLH